MKLLANTALFYDEDVVSYEILMTQDMLLFKPYFYHLDQRFPCIVLSRGAEGWQFQEAVDKGVEGQVLDDIAGLNILCAA